MKAIKIYATTLIVVLFSVFTATGTVITVSNHVLTAGQYTSAQDAVDAASPGDTIYVHGSNTAYGNLVLNKRLVIIGAGYEPQNTQYNLYTHFVNIQFNLSNSTTLATGTIIKGITTPNLSYSGSPTFNVNNILVERCYIGTLNVLGSNWVIKNNKIESLSLGNKSNIIVANNFIGAGISNSDKPSVLITNNIFIQDVHMSSVKYANITNNIWTNPSTNFNNPSGYQNSNNTFNKNIFVYADPTSFMVFPPAGNTGIGNVNTIDPQFVSNVLNISLNAVSQHDWHLRAGAIGVGYGTDGTDCGIYGGSYPMPNLTGVCTMPQISSMDLQNSVIPQGGTLNVELKGRAEK